MKVLVVGQGGREHALAWKLKQSPHADRVFCVPGNAGTAIDAENVNIAADDFDYLIRFAKREKIDLTVVGPEAPLAKGIVDAFEKEGLRIFGPTKAAARLESSKVFAKELMRSAAVPTADFQVFDHSTPAKEYVQTRDYPVVVKADGLAAGKGVIVCSNAEEAIAAIERIMVREEFGEEAGRQVVIEQRLSGEELSVLALVEGNTIVTLAPAQDYKPIYDGDKGPNTGGMGAYSPPAIATPNLMEQIDREILVPTVHAMKQQHCPYRGVLYAGLMITSRGPKVLEFNCRFGDPETQPVLMRLRSDLLELLDAAVEGRLEETGERVAWDPRPAVCVVMASGGYPGRYETGKIVRGLQDVQDMPDVKVFHAGTRLDGDLVYTTGGRVLGVTALGDTLAEARRRAYDAVRRIHFDGAYYRTDIADRAE